MHKERELVSHAVLFGKVVAYKCTACDRTFAVSLLYRAVPTGYPPPANVRDAFFRHACKVKTVGVAMSFLQAIYYRCLEFLMAVEDDDFPVSYLFYIIAVIAVTAFLIGGVFFLWFR